MIAAISRPFIPLDMTQVLTPDRSIVLIGLMGVGKTTVGRRLSKALGLKFRDADEEVEKAAGRSVALSLIHI